MVSIPVAVVIGLLSMLVGVGVAWGVLRTTVTQLTSLVATLQNDVRALSASVTVLSQDIAVMKALDEERKKRGGG